MKRTSSYVSGGTATMTLPAIFQIVGKQAGASFTQKDNRVGGSEAVQALFGTECHRSDCQGGLTRYTSGLANHDKDLHQHGSICALSNGQREKLAVKIIETCLRMVEWLGISPFAVVEAVLWERIHPR